MILNVFVSKYLVNIAHIAKIYAQPVHSLVNNFLDEILFLVQKMLVDGMHYDVVYWL